MPQIVECVPNFSEGRDPEVLARLREAIGSVPGAYLLDVHADASHNRSVFTLVGSPEAVSEAAFRAVRVAVERIDLNTHRGEHPRMGAADVVPFIPIDGLTMADCVALAQKLGQRIGTDLAVPVFLYARAAAKPDRERLPDVRKGEFEGLRERIGTDPSRDPDYGPRHIHRTAGATAVGARPFLVAFNIYLDTADVGVAEQIAKEIRTSNGGLPAVQAKGLEVEGRAQVSMNLLDIDVTSPALVFDTVERAGAKRNVTVASSEIVGLIPERAVVGAGARHLKLAAPVESHLLETKVRAVLGPSLDGWIDQLAGGSPTPGGGSAAALAGTLAAGLAAMVGRLTVGRKAYAAVSDEFAALITKAEKLRATLRQLVDDDAASYEGVGAAYRMPKQTPAEQEARRAAIDEALLHAAQVPLLTVRAAVDAGRLALRGAEAGNKNAVSDAAVAALLAHAAARGAALNVRVNVASMSQRSRGDTLLEEADRLTKEAGDLAEAAAARAIKPAS